ncbi:MAG: hypothetical protein V7609_1995 [Verrucomicrobiota bacterium]
MTIALVVLAYCIVIALAQFCLTLSTYLVGFPVALLLAWAPVRLRTFVSGIVSGVAGVTAAVAFAYFTFFILVGPESYGVLPFLASTVPLVIPILNDRAKAQQLSALERDMSPEVRAVTEPTTSAARYAVRGYYVGLFLAVFWFIVRYANAA